MYIRYINSQKQIDYWQLLIVDNSFIVHNRHNGVQDIIVMKKNNSTL